MPRRTTLLDSIYLYVGILATNISIKYLDSKKKIKTYEGIYTGKSEILNQDILKKNSSNLITITTGGTTGVPLKFEVNKNYHREFVAYRHALWAEWGFKRNARQICLNYVFKNDKTTYYNFRENALDINIAMLNQLSNDDVDLILSWGAKYLIGYPSTLTAFCYRLKELNRDLIGIKLIISGSEKLYDWQRKLLKNFFEVDVKCWYGMSEAAAFAFQCNKSEMYHFLPNIGYIALVENRVVNKEMGEISASKISRGGTNFMGYLTGDLGTNLKDSCPSCGIKVQTVDEIMGRSQDYLSDNSGNKFFVSAMNTHNLRLDCIVGFQFVQYENLQIDANFIPKTNEEECALNQFKTLVAEKLHKNFSIKINKVEQLIVTSRGKTPLIVKL